MDKTIYNTNNIVDFNSNKNSSLLRSSKKLSSLVEYFNSQRLKNKFCDVKIYPGIQTSNSPLKYLRAHKIILNFSSPYFAKLFKDSENLGAVNLSGLDYFTVEFLINFIYTGNCGDVNAENVEKILNGAALLKLEELKDLCAPVLFKELTLGNCLVKWESAAHLDAENPNENYYKQTWKSCSIDFIFSSSDHYNQVFLTETFSRLSNEQIESLVSSATLKNFSPEIILKGILAWVKSDCGSRQGFLTQLLQLINLKCVPMPSLRKYFREDPILTTNLECQLIYLDLLEEMAMLRDVNSALNKSELHNGQRCKENYLAGDGNKEEILSNSNKDSSSPQEFGQKENQRKIQTEVDCLRIKVDQNSSQNSFISNSCSNVEIMKIPITKVEVSKNHFPPQSQRLFRSASTKHNPRKLIVENVPTFQEKNILGENPIHESANSEENFSNFTSKPILKLERKNSSRCNFRSKSVQPYSSRMLRCPLSQMELFKRRSKLSSYDLFQAPSISATATKENSPKKKTLAWPPPLPGTIHAPRTAGKRGRPHKRKSRISFSRRNYGNSRMSLPPAYSLQTVAESEMNLLARGTPSRIFTRMSANFRTKRLMFYVQDSSKEERYLMSYDFNTKAHSKIAGYPFAGIGNSFVFHQSSLYDFGGKFKDSANNRVDVFDFEPGQGEKSKWRSRRVPLMSMPRYGFHCAVLKDYIYAIGGFHTIGAMNLCERLNLGLDGGNSNKYSNWEVISPMNRTRGQCGVAEFRGKIFVVGGFSMESEEKSLQVTSTNSVECFDPTNNKWTWCTGMQSERSGLCLVVLNDKLFAIGGGLTRFPEYSRSKLKSVEVYDDDTFEWKYCASMKRARQNFSAVVFDDNIFAIGGDDEKDPTIEKFDSLQNSWTIVDHLPSSGIYQSVGFKDASDV